VRTLGNELRAGHLAHAYLFAGIRGTGKTSAARILARAVNCAEPVDGEPCNRCAACLEILDGSAVDVLEIDAASNRGIDEMRDLRERVRYLPARLRTKVYIIDEAHMLTTEAWNAFLKTLEEPPAHVLFILCTTEPHKVPDTVRSRVQRFDFGRVSGSLIDAHLQSIAARERVELDPGASRLIARAAQGSVRDALSLLDQCLATGDRPVTPETCRGALGLAHPGVVRDLLEGLAERDAAAALRATAVAFSAGADPRQLLRECARLARAAEMVAVGFPEGAHLEADEEELCRRLASRQPDGFWLRVLDQTSATELELRQPVDARLQVEACLLRLCRGDPEGGEAERLAGVEARLGEVERRLAAGRPREEAAPPRPPTRLPADPAAPRPAADGPSTAPEGARSEAPTPHPGGVASSLPAAGGPLPAGGEGGEAPDRRGAVTGSATAADATPAEDLVSVEAWQRAWPALIEAVNRRDRGFAGILRGCRPLEADAGRLVVGAPYQFHLKQLRNPAKTPILVAAVAATAGGARAVTVAFCGESSADVGEEVDEATGNLTEAVVATFAGSRVMSTRLVDRVHDVSEGGDPATGGEGSPGPA